MIGKDWRGSALTADPKLVTVVIATALTIIINIIGIQRGLSLITPHIFYIPIILASYWFPRRGVLFAVIIGIFNLGSIYLIGPGDLPMLTFATSAASFYILVAVSVVTSSLSGSLRNKDILYKGIFAHSEAGVLIVSNRGEEPVIREINARGAGMLDYRPSDLEGKSLSTLWCDRNDLSAFLSTLNRQGAVRNHETTFLSKERKEIPVLISAGELPDRILVITVLDISTRKRIEHEMEEKNKQLAVINKLITSANAATTTNELLGSALKNVQDILHCEHAAVYLEPEEEDFQSPSFISPEGSRVPGPDLVWGRGRSGAREGATFFKGDPLYYSSPAGETPPGSIRTAALIPLLCGNRQVGALYLASSDRPEFTREEHAILCAAGKELACALMKIHLTEEIHEANRMANLYLDVLVHDINNANMAAQGYGHLLLEMVDGSARDITRKMMEGIRRSGEVLKNLEIVRKIHERTPTLTDVSLDPVIKNEIRRHPGAKIQYSGTRAVVSADDLLGAVFSNLIQNSLKFGGAGVQIVIDVIETGTGLIQIEVTDTGPGIPDAIKPVLFSRFQSLDAAPRSAATKGLGLYIVKALIDRYHGDIQVEDRVSGHPEEGTVFRITLHAARTTLLRKI